MKNTGTQHVADFIPQAGGRTHRIKGRAPIKRRENSLKEKTRLKDQNGKEILCVSQRMSACLTVHRRRLEK